MIMHADFMNSLIERQWNIHSFISYIFFTLQDHLKSNSEGKKVIKKVVKNWDQVCDLAYTLSLKISRLNSLTSINKMSMDMHFHIMVVFVALFF